jgi:arylsulfatase A-like enzyme
VIRRRTALAVTLAVASLAAGSHAEDVLPALGRAEICAGQRDVCIAPRDAAALHAPPASAPGVVRLPPGTRSHLYVRLPAAATLRLAFGGAGLVVSAKTDDAPERELYRATGASEDATIDLRPFSGRIVRLALAAAAEGTGTDVRRALVESAVDSPRAPRLPDGVPAGHPNVLLYVIDTLRADHLGAYGYARPTSPRIDQLARAGIRFTCAVAQSSWTLPSIASILTGRTPAGHGAVGPETAIGDDVPTLPEMLRDAGYVTAGFVTNYLGSGVFGLDRGFGTYRFYREEGERRPSVYLGSDALARRVLRWLAHGPREPFFLYVHATDPHFPYRPPPRYARPFLSAAAARRLPSLIEDVRPLHNGRDEWGARPVSLSAPDVDVLRDAYDGDVRMADAQFGRTVDALAARGLLDRTLVVLTSDHGEEFLEHGGVAHGQTLYAESLHVPLVVRLPGARDGASSEALAQHVDIVPTILDVAGVAPPPGLAGVSLLGAPKPAAEAYAALSLGPFALDALIGDGWKVIRDRSRRVDRRFEVYETDRDPGDRMDVAADVPVLVGYARSRLQEIAAAPRSGPRVPEDRLERLRALGYVSR